MGNSFTWIARPSQPPLCSLAKPFSYRYEFLICSFSIRNIRQRTIMLKPFLILIASLALPVSLAAQELPSQDPLLQIVALSEPGVEIQRGQDFVLRTHGQWPEQISAVQPSSPETVSLQKQATRIKAVSATKPRRLSSFRRSVYLPWVSSAEVRHSLPAGLLDALIWVESKYNPLAVSPKGAGGLGQLMPPTASSLGVGNRFDPQENIEGAARYLRQMLDKFGLVHLAVAAYNAGPGAVSRAKGIPANKETPGYVRDVLSRWAVFGNRS
jgi:soluble lytic murein transglycosylase-like protein